MDRQADLEQALAPIAPCVAGIAAAYAALSLLGGLGVMPHPMYTPPQCAL